MKEPVNLSVRIESMSTQELLSYMSSVKIAKVVCNVAGVTSILMSLILTNTFMIFLTGIILYFFGNMAVEVDRTSVLVKEQMRKRGIG